jgi:hypothetical protein
MAAAPLLDAFLDSGALPLRYFTIQSNLVAGTTFLFMRTTAVSWDRVVR